MLFDGTASVLWFYAKPFRWKQKIPSINCFTSRNCHPPLAAAKSQDADDRYQTTSNNNSDDNKPVARTVCSQVEEQNYI